MTFLAAAPPSPESSEPEPTLEPVVDPAVEGAAAVARGVARLFARHDIMLLSEVPLPNKRRADLMGVDAKGAVVIVEIKVARADLLGDAKWPEYLDYCDRFYWALPPELDAAPLEREDYLPTRAGVIVADGYDAEIIRPAATHALSAARRKKQVAELARRAMRRLSYHCGWIDPATAARTDP